jgi:hypothetical protein
LISLSVHIATAVANRVEPSWKMDSKQQNSNLQIVIGLTAPSAFARRYSVMLCD